MEKLSKARNVMEYVIIIALYYVTGGAFSYTNYSFQIIIFFLSGLLICVLSFKIQNILRPRILIPWASMTFFIILVPLLFNDSISTYIAIVMQIFIGMFCAMVIPMDEFVRKYINVIVVFAAISIVGFIICIAYPTIAQNFPFVKGDASVDYYNAGVYVFMRMKEPTSFTLMMRNPGICWEPGCYQCFLNIGLLFLCESERKEHQKYFYIKFFVLVITLLTTVSTTGLILLVIILFAYWKQWYRGVKWGWVLFPVFIIVIMWLYQTGELGATLQYKFGSEFGESKGFIERISLNRIPYLFSESGRPYFFGMSFRKWLTYDKTSWNSIIHSLLCLGTPFTIIQLVGYWLGSRVLAKRGALLFFIMVISASTETLFWRVLFNTIAFYGWIHYSTKRKYKMCRVYKEMS